MVKLNKANQFAFTLSFLLLLCNSLKCDLVEFDKLRLSINSVINVKKFVFMNYTIHDSVNKTTGFNIDLDVEYRSKVENITDMFHIYILRPYSVPHFDFLNNPALCCSRHGAIICDDFENYPVKKKSDQSKLLKTHSVYSAGFVLNQTNERYKIQENKSIEMEGVYYTLFLLCSMNHTELSGDNETDVHKQASFSNKNLEVLTISGNILYYNPFGYLSGDDVYNIDMYLIFTIVYVSSSLYWFYKVILYYSFLGFYQKLINILIPLIILESLVYQAIYNVINEDGKSNILYEFTLVFCSLSKNLILRLIVVLISLGYEFITEKIKKKNIISWLFLFISYAISFVFYAVFNKTYKNNESGLAYLILSASFLVAINFYMIYKVYRGLKKQVTYIKYQNLDQLQSLYGFFRLVTFTSIIVGILWVMIEILWRLFAIFDEIWNLNWVLDVLSQLVPLIFYISFLYALHPSEETQKSLAKEFSNFHSEENYKAHEGEKQISINHSDRTESDLRAVELK